FGYATFAICWAWINFLWFSSAYDTDDWIFRLVTMMQMIGVLILAIGLPKMFASIERGERIDNSARHGTRTISPSVTPCSPPLPSVRESWERLRRFRPWLHRRVGRPTR